MSHFSRMYPKLLEILIPIRIPILSTDTIDLPIYFARPEEEGRTEEPTPRKRERERERGNVPKSPDIPSSLVLLGVSLFLIFWGEKIYSILVEWIETFFRESIYMKELSQEVFLYTLGKLFLILVPILLLALLLGVGGNVLQTGFLFSTYPLRIDFSRISFTFQKLIEKIWINRRTMVFLGKVFLKVVLAIGISYWIIQEEFLSILNLPLMDIREGFMLFIQLALKLLLIGGILFVFIGALDYLYQRYEYLESLKMTREELKEELKMEEGDPLIRQRQRQRMMDLLKRSMLKEVPKADVVITNPFHYAVALLYEIDPLDKENAPRVIAKGEDLLALEIRKIAKEHGVPIVEDPPLARDLYYSVEINEKVPPRFFEALVIIYSRLEKFREKFRSYSA